MLAREENGSVAPTVALSLVALIAAGGLAFDYARLAAMDTELQNAADQAALAAATQLDGKANTCSRASAAAVSFLQNRTYFANDGAGMGVTLTSEPTCDATGLIRFYKDKAKTTAATTDADAHFVEVTVNSRTAKYALTPIVARLSSGAIGATAFAGMGSAICKVPPVMMCNPDEPIGNTNVNYDFNVGSRVGVGIKLIGDGSYAPGNFGFLETGFGNGANDLLKAMGYNSPPGECVAIDGVETKTGLNASVMDGLNTRFDVDANGNSCPAGGTCSPALNVRKDLVRGTDCGVTGNGWQEVEAKIEDLASDTPPLYRPTSNAALASTVTPVLMGHPRDICHAWSSAGSCTGGAGGRVGDGTWDRAAYFRSNHPGVAWQSEAGLGANVTRYQTYVWEMGNPTTRLATQTVAGSKAAYSTPQAGQCLAPGITPGGSNVDRRRISMAVLNCDALNINGHEIDQPVIKWVDLFLVEPAFDRSNCNKGKDCNVKLTDKTEIYVEVIGETGTGAAGATAGQVVRRDVPYLIE